MPSPLISIIIPNFNGADYIERTIQSVIEQPYLHREIIVVDGASSDRSMEIIDTYRAHFAAVISEPDKGHGDALQKGFARSTGDIMCWINSDDILMPNALGAVADIFDQFDDVDWICGNTTLLSQEDYVLRSSGPRPHSRIRFLAGDYKWIQQESVFWRRSLWKKAGSYIDDTLKLAVDADLWLRFFRHAKLQPVELALGAFRLRDDQRSFAREAEYADELELCVQLERRHSLSEGYAKYFEAILAAPFKARTRGEAEALSPRLRDEDLKPLTFDPRAHQWVRPDAPLPPSPAAPAAHPKLPKERKDLFGLFDKHKGERCVIVGNGPSLNEMDLSVFEGETILAANSIFLLFDRVKWRPRYYACVDTRVLPDIAPQIVEMHVANPGMHVFVPKHLSVYDGKGTTIDTQTIIPPAPNLHYLNQRNPDRTNLPWGAFSLNAGDWVATPNTVTVTLLQIAYYLGFNEIYLIGCDTSYSVPNTVKAENNGLFLTSTADDDPNHFDPRYFGKDRQWHAPRVDDMLWHYYQAAQMLEEAGTQVFNAGIGGRLEYFQRVDYRAEFGVPAQV